MARRRSARVPEAPARGRRIALLLAAAGLAAAVGIAAFLRERAPRGILLEGDTRAPSSVDRAAIDVAERFLNHWSRFEYGEALLVSTGDARDRVLQAMEKELALDEGERAIAAELRAEVEGVRFELRARSVRDVGEHRKIVKGTGYGHVGGEVYERDQTFDVRSADGGWKVARWDLGRRPGDKTR